MPEETKVDVQRLRDLAAVFGALLDEHAQTVDQLYGYVPDLGDFDTARWLGDLVTDRRDTVLAHAAYLRATLAEVDAALLRIAGEFEAAEVDNAAAVDGFGSPPSG
ncbi:hypothetical protein [Actinoplanes derwentensis]|uniref:Excreted virulence factor EspC, type VII ESX diderm n=1 Tax=Actinoplanes derwentensis TaxID=113562 RepID=A0A1H2C7X8_9ACTN|nr:hypothetical protein [Actinoplanes derwentensis]SDT66491.1 hypothetical protein SAMN04489716_5356 [Actinoplanes derwentensis]